MSSCVGELGVFCVIVCEPMPHLSWLFHLLQPSAFNYRSERAHATPQVASMPLLRAYIPSAVASLRLLTALAANYRRVGELEWELPGGVFKCATLEIRTEKDVPSPVIPKDSLGAV